jgi:hypothetical protein
MVMTTNVIVTEAMMVMVMVMIMVMVRSPAADSAAAAL